MRLRASGMKRRNESCMKEYEEYSCVLVQGRVVQLLSKVRLVPLVLS